MFLEHDSLMPSGKFEGTKMKDVPVWYYILCYDDDRLTPDVKKYVRRNYMKIWKESKKKK